MRPVVIIILIYAYLDLKRQGSRNLELDNFGRGIVNTAESIPPEKFLEDSFARIARNTKYGLSAFVDKITDQLIVNGTEVTLHHYYVKLDGNGRPRIRDLQKALSDHAVDFSFPREKIARAIREREEYGAFAPLAKLTNKARDLFTEISNTGEGGELLLFAFAEQMLKIPLVIAKMHLKTDEQMHIHGADGVYAGLDSDDRHLCLYWGESKVYGDRSKAIADCIDSLAKMLNEAGGIKHEASRDLDLLRDYLDLGDIELTNAVKGLLDPENPAFNTVEFRGVCLFAYDNSNYPDRPKKIEEILLREKLKEDITKNIKSLQHQAKKHGIETFEVHSLALPVPSADEFRKSFLQAIGAKV